MRNDDRINEIIERRLHSREDYDDCRSLSINEHNRKIRGIRENAGTAKPEPDMVVEANETVSEERVETSRSSSDPEVGSKNLLAEFYAKTEPDDTKKNEERDKRSLLEHSPQYRFRHSVQAKFSPDAKCPLWEEHVELSTGGQERHEAASSGNYGVSHRSV